MSLRRCSPSSLEMMRTRVYKGQKGPGPGLGSISEINRRHQRSIELEAKSIQKQSHTLSLFTSALRTTHKMLNIYTIATLLLLSLSSSSSLATARSLPLTCGTCNPLSGQNSCDITTSCINTGTRFHCACRAGFKASPDNGDITKHFRLRMPDYGFLVFTPEGTVCDTPCDNHDGAAGEELCAEVPVYEQCEV